MGVSIDILHLSLCRQSESCGGFFSPNICEVLPFWQHTDLCLWSVAWYPIGWVIMYSAAFQVEFASGSGGCVPWWRCRLASMISFIQFHTLQVNKSNCKDKTITTKGVDLKQDGRPDQCLHLKLGDILYWIPGYPWLPWLAWFWYTHIYFFPMTEDLEQPRNLVLSKKAVSVHVRPCWGLEKKTNLQSMQLMGMDVTHPGWSSSSYPHVC